MAGACCLFAFAVSARPAPGEEKLKKDGVEYLGWQTGKDEFTTCNNTKMLIGNGKVEKTDDKCPKDGGPGAAKPWPGTTVEIDGNIKTAQLRQTGIFSAFSKWTARIELIQAGEAVTLIRKGNSNATTRRILYLDIPFMRIELPEIPV